MYLPSLLAYNKMVSLGRNQQCFLNAESDCNVEFDQLIHCRHNGIHHAVAPQTLYMAALVQKFLFSVCASAGPVGDAERGAGSGPPGHGSCPAVVPLPGHLPGGGRHPRPHTGSPAGFALPHNEGVIRQTNQIYLFLLLMFLN